MAKSDLAATPGTALAPLVQAHEVWLTSINELSCRKTDTNIWYQITCSAFIQRHYYLLLLLLLLLKK